jgi:hypothetical protein
MKTDAYTKTMLAVIVVCLVLLFFAHMKLARAAEGMLAFMEDEAERRAEAIKQAEAKRQSEAEKQMEAIKQLETKRRLPPLGFTAKPFTTS